MFKQNHLCSLLLPRHFLLRLLTPLTMLILILTPEASGVGARMHILMLGCFTQMLPATAPLALNLPINVMRMQKSVNMVTALEILNMGVFTPLVFTSTGSMGREATVFYRCLADLLATYWGQQYSQTINWLRCRLSFALLGCAIMCIRGSRSSTHRPVFGPLDLSVVLAESWLTN